MAPHIDDMVNKPYQTVDRMNCAMRCHQVEQIPSVRTSSLGTKYQLISTNRCITCYVLPRNGSSPGRPEQGTTEIDSVVGMGRLPDFGDEKSLPCVSAVVEVMRWLSRGHASRCALPCILPHDNKLTCSYDLLTHSGSSLPDCGRCL